MNRLLGIIALLGALAVVLGAFGAHYLNERVDTDTVASFETGVRYQMYHLLLLLIVLTNQRFSLKAKKRISLLLLIGIIFFSGSIYAITFGVDPATIWFITPLGGLCFIAGWLMLAWSFFKLRK